MKRVPTGIPGFDEMIEGGFPEESMILMDGYPGTLKTIFSLQFLYNGGRAGEPGVFISLNENVEDLKEQAEQFGWRFEKLPVTLKHFDIIREPDLESRIVEEIKKSKAKRFVIDSLSSFLGKAPLVASDFDSERIFDAIRGVSSIRMPEDILVRALVWNLLKKLQGFGLSGLLVFEESQFEVAKDVCEYLADGVLSMRKNLALNSYVVVIEKMRNTKHEIGENKITIEKDGLKVGKL